MNELFVHERKSHTAEIDSRTVDQDIQIFLQIVNTYLTKHSRCNLSRSLAFGIEGLSNFPNPRVPSGSLFSPFFTLYSKLRPKTFISARRFQEKEPRIP